jgi:hypothetical protein
VSAAMAIGHEFHDKCRRRFYNDVTVPESGLAAYIPRTGRALIICHRDGMAASGLLRPGGSMDESSELAWVHTYRVTERGRAQPFQETEARVPHVP